MASMADGGIAYGGMAQPIFLGERPRILIITLRRLGDVLLTTPLIRSLKAGFPGSAVDVLVFRGTEGMLQGNQDIGRVISTPQRPSIGEMLVLLRRLWRRYDLAVATHTGDRPTLFAWAAGRRRLGFVAEADSARWLKRHVFHRGVPAQPQNHRVFELLRLAAALGIDRQSEMVCPDGGSAPHLPGRYAVLHASPMFRIRRWTDAGWRALAGALAQRGLTVVATGARDPAEKDYLDHLWGGLEPAVTRLDGRLGWPDLTALLRSAAVYVGPDTSITHLAAAAAAPTVALYGPASPSLIGPWPIGGLCQPWARANTVQHQGNVWVVQNPLPCMPCDKLGCEGHLESRSQCLDELSVRQVLIAVDDALRFGAGREPAPRLAAHRS
jgi:heptosyltransferase-3